jgi:1-deoxy-D-xylulose-5-phosphate synthase
VKRVGIPDQFVEHGAPKYYLEAFGLTPEGVAKAAQELVGKVKSEVLRRRRVKLAGED